MNQDYFKKGQSKLGVIFIFALFIVALLTLNFWRRLFCKAAKVVDTPFQDPSVGGVVSNDWLKKEMPFYINQLYSQLSTNYWVTDVFTGGVAARCQIYEKVYNLLPNQLIAVANEYKNKKCKTLREHIGQANYSGCSISSVIFGDTIEKALLDKLNRLNIT